MSPLRPARRDAVVIRATVSAGALVVGWQLPAPWIVASVALVIGLWRPRGRRRASSGWSVWTTSRGSRRGGCASRCAASRGSWEAARVRVPLLWGLVALLAGLLIGALPSGAGDA